MTSIIHTVRSLDHPSLAPYRTLRRPMDHFSRGIFVGEGEKVVRKMLESSCEIVSFLLTKAWLEQLESEERAFRRSSAEIFVADRFLLEEIVGHRLHQGIMAIGKIPPDPSIEWVASCGLVVVLDGLARAENVGTIVRNAVAFGADAVLVGETSASPWMRRAVRNSMGTVFSVKVHHCYDLRKDLTVLKEHGMMIMAADVKGDVALSDLKIGGPVCLVLGNEDRGISPEVLAISEHRISIPMLKGTDSLNVASAGAVFLYEIRERRGE